ncbi:Retrovirus-related Pol polyprotein from transposon TNT 1-94 [Bienertia sinuspersici]
MNPLPNITHAYRLLVQEEKHKQISQSNVTDSVAFISQKRRFGDSDKYSSKNTQGFKGSYNTNNTNNYRKNYFCDHCKIPGHSVQRCFRLHGFPPANSQFKIDKNKKMAAVAQQDSVNEDSEQYDIDAVKPNFSQDQVQQFLAFLNKQKHNSDEEPSTSKSANVAGIFCLLSSASNGWVLDSGATDHMTHDLSMFHSLHDIESSQGSITIPDGTKIQIKYSGDIELQHGLSLRDVLYVPHFKFNLISIPKLCQDMDCTAMFTDSKCFVQGLSMRPMLLGSLRNGLYYLDDSLMNSSTVDIDKTSSKPLANISTSSVVADHNTKLWHLRLGHIPFSQLKFTGVISDSKNCNIDSICQICPMARQTRLPFPSSYIKSLVPFELLHLDIWGPYKVSTHDGCNSFLTIVDDFTRMTWVYLLSYKSDVAKIFENFHSYVVTQFNFTIHTIRTDNAQEFKEGPMKLFCLNKGILQQRSCSNTPQQNGVVERKHRHLLEVSRALFFQSKVPKHFWGECVLTATHIINRLPLSVLNNVSPFQKLFNITPDLNHLRVFGCLCFVSTSKVQRSKFDPRAEPHVFIGYSPGQKAYKVLNLQTHKIIFSRDVVFHEQHFPFHISTSSSENNFNFFLPIATDFSTFTVFDIPDIFCTASSPLSFSDSSLPSSIQISSSSSTNNSSDSNVHSSSPNFSSPPISLRKSQRSHTQPAYLSDYVCNIVTFSNLSTAHKAFITKTENLVEPLTYSEAIKDSRWVEAMNKELKALQDNKTWILMDLPPGKKTISCKWVYKIKFKADGSIERFKARLVARGCTQKSGIDFDETFSPVVKMSTVRCILSIAAHKGWKLYQLDVNNAFLHGDLHEEVYMRAPEGFPNPDKKVCRLVKSLYGLKQASRQWFAKLLTELQLQGFTQSKNDYSLFLKYNGSLVTILAVYVDDIVLTGDDYQNILAIKHHLDLVFSIKDLGFMGYFLGIEIGYLPQGITMTQKKFTSELLQSYAPADHKPVVTPLPINLKLSASEGDLFDDPSLYRTIVGKINFLTHTRPDLSYTVQHLSQFLQEPRVPHFKALQHVLRYLSCTAGQGILLNGSSELNLQAFSDSDWGACLDSRRSISGYILMLGKSPISWKSKKQHTVSKSSSEAEYRALSHAAAEVTWVVRLLEEFGLTNLQPVTLFCDNQSSIHIAKNPVHHERTKHIEIDVHFTRDKILEGLLHLAYVPTSEQLADVFTKVLPSSQFSHLLSNLGMCTPMPSLRGILRILSLINSSLAVCNEELVTSVFILITNSLPAVQLVSFYE